MTGQEVIEAMGLMRAKSIDSKGTKPLESESLVFEQVRDFGIDSVYFNTDDYGNSFPAMFLKKVNSFEYNTLQEIVEIHRKAWNYKKVLFLYVYSDTEIRIYNCSEKPLIKTTENFNCEKELRNIEIKTYYFSDKQQLEQLNNLFSTAAIDSGIIWTLKEAQFIREKISLKRRVDKYLVTSLINTSNQLEQQGLKLELINKIILRSLFLLYLEDRGATNENLYSQIKKGAKSYFDILNDTKSTYHLFGLLEEDFNGNIFTVEKDEEVSEEHLQLIKKCFTNGNDNTPQTKLFEDWRLFDFSIIQIELLSEIYENFLFKTDPYLKKQTGAYYTPPSLVEFILNEKLPINKTEKNYNLKILDPSCGSGIFLVESFKRLVKRYENQHKEKLTDFHKLKKLLTDNIFGIELHQQAIKVAAFSLYLALVDNLDPKTLWQTETHRLPNLINDPNDKSLKIQGGNLFCRDTIKHNKEIEELEFDLIIGNPPFGTTQLPESVRSYCNKYNFAKEMVLPFLHKATVLAPNGQIALVFNSKVLTNTGGTYEIFRQWLFNDCYVEKVFNFSILRKAKKNFGGQLFGDATGPISIVFYQKNLPKKPNDKIAYYAPKTFIKSNIIEGLSIDFTDLKYLPREECQKPDTKIWKVAMWGGMNDWKLIKRLSNPKLDSVEDFAKKTNIESGVGFQLLTQRKDKPQYSQTLSNLKYLDADSITKYYTSEDVLDNVIKSIKGQKAIDFYKDFYRVQNITDIKQLTAFRRLGDIKAFANQHIVVKKGLEQNSVCASIIENKCSFRDGVYGFYTTRDEDIEELYLLLSYFNSKLSTYYLFMTISSYGIEREQIMKKEYLSIPINLSNNQSAHIKKATKEILSNFKSKDLWNISVTGQEIETKINNVIYESFNLSQNDINLIDDSVRYNLDLFHKQEKSIALHPTSLEQTTHYAELICAELNDFLCEQDLSVHATIYNVSRLVPLVMIKLSFGIKQKEVVTSKEFVDEELKKLDHILWEEKSTSIYFRKRLNFKTGNEIYLIRPNQCRFWSKSMAVEDASELILEILNGN